MICVFQSTMNPDMGFALDFQPEYYEEGKRLAEIGWNAWWYATHPEDWNDESVLNKEDVENCYDLGYMDTALDLLTENNIPYTEIECHDEDGNFDTDMIIEYEDWI